MPAARSLVPRVAGFATSALLSLTACVAAAHAQGGVRPTPEAAQALLQTRPDLVAQLRQRLVTSGMTPEQVRARLKAEGYPENLLDAYLPGGSGGSGAPSSSAISAMRALGVMDGTDADDLNAAMTGRPTKAAPVADPDANAQAGAGGGSTEIFGLSIFRQGTTRFQPNLDGPVDAGYKIGPGDELVLILTGDVELSYNLEVTRGGFIVIPQVGQIGVANLTLGQLEDLLYNRLGKVYSGVKRGGDATTRFSITVSRLRTNQVFVVGDVATPGAYRISSAGTALTALYAAGGPSERGSMRAVQVQRGGKVVATLDIYSYLLRGDASQDVRLQQGDVLFVPIRGARVRVDGEVTRPATYELKAGEQLADVLAAAGGFRTTATARRILVDRILPRSSRPVEGKERTTIDLALASDATVPTFAVLDGDVVRVPRITDRVRNRISVSGHVWAPGTQGYTAGLTLEDALKRAGGLRPDTYLGRVLVSRLNADATRTILRAILRDSTGATLSPFVLEPDDEVTVYSLTGFRPDRYVAIAGAVNKGGQFAYREGMTLRDLVMQAGGLTEYAELRQAEIARRPDVPSEKVVATTVRVGLDSSYRFSEGRPVPPGSDVVLKPYDNVLILQNPDMHAPITVQLTGEVRFPGTYTLRSRTERLGDIIDRAGGFTDNSDASAGYFSRRLIETAQVNRLVKAAGVVRSDSSGAVIGAVNDAEKLDAGGGRIRVGVDIPTALADRSSPDNLFLVEGDSLYIPAKQQTVTVRGEVNAPTSVVASGRSLGAYIRAGGGPTELANTSHAYVIQPNGKIESRRRYLGINFDPTPKAGATVVVPTRGEKQSATAALQTLAVIAQSLSALLTAIILIKK